MPKPYHTPKSERDEAEGQLLDAEYERTTEPGTPEREHEECHERAGSLDSTGALCAEQAR